METGLVGRIMRGYLSVLRVVALLGAVLLGAAACGVAITLPLWLLATRATKAYNWSIVGAAVVVLGAVATTRLLREARRAPSVGRYLYRAAAVAAHIAGRAVGVAFLALFELTAFARWGTLPGLLALPLVLALGGVLLFVHPARLRKGSER